ncbi:hypothetical protein NLM33_47185 (plasmid) [Bradyrhizobium sp. CCGUVB1N3]|uniref:hypothetical protein n=1 Tax=Bradyrhizobium sp. CCGUVB1N3 TaxID=2949629 RepID=UPI0020B26F5F|nr:hypothetical protein [Bradyrhizobium sp. CCGUVB1N3]MCP3477715.1 hypothetical protein [Bradyrhizobium sp. CCGUVB1N3]
MLKMMAELAPVATWREKRVRIEHGDVIGPDAFEKVAQLGLVVIQNPIHLALPLTGGQKNFSLSDQDAKFFIEIK